MLSPLHIKIKVIHPPHPNMSASPPTISMLNEEDAHIHKHKVTLDKAKHAKEE